MYIYICKYVFVATEVCVQMNFQLISLILIIQCRRRVFFWVCISSLSMNILNAGPGCVGTCLWYTRICDSGLWMKTLINN